MSDFKGTAEDHKEMGRARYFTAMGRAAREAGVSYEVAQKALRARDILYSPGQPDAADPKDRRDMLVVGARVWVWEGEGDDRKMIVAGASRL